MPIPFRVTILPLLRSSRQGPPPPLAHHRPMAGGAEDERKMIARHHYRRGVQAILLHTGAGWRLSPGIPEPSGWLSSGKGVEEDCTTSPSAWSVNHLCLQGSGVMVISFHTCVEWCWSGAEWLVFRMLRSGGGSYNITSITLTYYVRLTTISLIYRLSCK